MEWRGTVHTATFCCRPYLFCSISNLSGLKQFFLKSCGVSFCGHFSRSILCSADIRRGASCFLKSAPSQLHPIIPPRPGTWTTHRALGTFPCSDAPLTGGAPAGFSCLHAQPATLLGRQEEESLHRADEWLSAHGGGKSWLERHW